MTVPTVITLRSTDFRAEQRYLLAERCIFDGYRFSIVDVPAGDERNLATMDPETLRDTVVSLGIPHTSYICAFDLNSVIQYTPNPATYADNTVTLESFMQDGITIAMNVYLKGERMLAIEGSETYSSEKVINTLLPHLDVPVREILTPHETGWSFMNAPAEQYVMFEQCDWLNKDRDFKLYELAVNAMDYTNMSSRELIALFGDVAGLNQNSLYQAVRLSDLPQHTLA